MCFKTIFRELAILHIPLVKNIKWMTTINTDLRNDNKTINTSCAAGDVTGYAVSIRGILKAEFLLEYVLKHIKGGNLVPTAQMVMGVDELNHDVC